ncbi:hypothetical protein F4778DRAFT_531226 [Xylariomycetidae sp. FL2044]|nr:hypothetical protein F4778DRAFT_531226 [Xylariomycetidae sp. FL2044]
MADEMPPTKGVVLQDQPVLDAGESQAQSTQESLLEPLDESQASHMEGLVSDSDVQYLDKVTQSAVIAPPATYITRPAIETPEEMMSEFQYSKPPPRTNTKDRGGKGTQQAKTPLPAISKPPESSKQNMSPVKQLSEEDSMNSSTSSKSLPMLPAQEDHGAKSPQMTSGPLPSIPIAGSTRPSNSIMRDPEVQEVSSTSPQKAGSSPYPFKDQIDPPKSSKSHQVAKSPLSKPRYPKSIMNARERARIQMASQSRLSTPKATSTHALDSADPSSSRHTLSKSRPVVKDLKISRSHTHYPDTRTASQHPASQDNHRTMARQRNGWDHRGHELARPLLADQPHSRPYSSVSQESNISKRRTRYQSHIDQVPISSAWEASDKYFEKFAKPWNGYVLHTQQVKKWSIAEISHLNKLAEEQQAKIELYSQELAERDQAIADLTEEKGKVVQEYQQLENKYTDSSSRLTKLKEDMRTYRGRLNDATSEQQRLLAHCRDKCQRTIAEIRTKEQEQSMTVQNALEAAELARTTIQQKVLAVKEASRKQAAETEKTVGSLQAQLAERENEMATEKKQTEDLREQLAESRRLNETVLQSILSQNTDILEKVNRPPEVPIDMQLSLDEQDRKIDAIMEALEAVKAAAPDAADMMNEFKAIQDDSAKGILEVVRDEMSNRMSPHEEIEIMSHSIAAVQEMCEEIYEYVQNDETIAFWQEKSQEAIATADGRLEQIQGLRDDLNNAQTILNQQIDTNRHLQQEAQKVHDLRAQVSQLQQTVNDREATTAVSDESLKKAQQELSTQARKLEIFEETLENERQKHAQAIEKRNREHEHALEKAVVTATVRLRDEQQQMKTRLQELDQDRSR